MRKILETKDLILRELNLSDAQNFYSLNLNPNVIKYTGDLAFKSVQEAEDFLKNYQDYKINGYGRWAVIHKNSNKFIGWCGLKFEDGQTNIGYRFFEDEWNKGYATQSALACLNYGFEQLNLKCIIGKAMKENAASIKVLQKIGLKYEKDIDFNGQAGVIYKIKILHSS